MHLPTSASEPEAPQTIELTHLPARSFWGLVGLVVLTAGSLGLAWLFPDATMVHFLWVAQAVPILYFLLVWWGIQPTHPDDDAP
jgi:hypothetical protein